MFLSLVSALAIGLAVIVGIVTLILPFILGLFDRRNFP